MEKKLLVALATVTTMVFAGAANSAIIYDDFESGAGNWTTSTSSYLTTHDFGSGAEGVVALDTEVGTGTPLTLTSPLQLTTWGATTLNINFTGEWGSTGATTRFFDLQRSSNNGSTWTNIVRLNTNQLPAAAGYDVAASNFSDQFLFRFLPKDDGNNTSNVYAFFLNDVTITHDGVIPEPASLGLLGLGALAMGRRRR